MKRVFTFALAAVMLVSLCACSSQTQTQTQAAAAVTAQPETITITEPTTATTTVADLSAPAAQADIIYRNLNTLRADENGRSFWYTVTDLDHNGRLEFISAITEGSGNYTTAKMYEINASYSGLDPVSLGLSAGQYSPEVIVNSTNVYKDSNNLYHYVFDDTNSDTSVSGSHYKTVVSLTLSNSAVTSKDLAYQDISYANGFTVYTFYDENGKEVSDPSSFSMNTVADKYYSGATKSTVNFDWFAIGDVTSSQRLLTSYNVFGGTQAPTTTVNVTPAPVTTPQPTTYIVDVTNPRITKNPTSESVYAGGSCSFVAQAIGYNSMKWQLVSPSGMVYDAATSNPYPATLNIYGSTGQTLTLSNIPLDMNNWTARAVFYGDTESVTSTGAGIYVSSAPAPVYVTISFSPGSGTSFSDSYNSVYVYSSNGSNIHVECCQSGNTGAYYSDTVSSGSPIPIQGISGQYVTVDVYASCGDSSTVATYYVNCAPTPSGETKYGTVQYCDGDSAYITFNDGTSGTYYIAYMCSNPPKAGVSCVCTFDAYGNLTDFSFDYEEP